MRTRIAPLLICLCACRHANAAPAIRNPALPSDPSAWRWEQVGKDVYAMIAPEGVTPIVSGNAVVIVGDDGVLVVDTTQFPSTARVLVDHIEHVTDKPVRFVVDTHWHPDHWTGNGEVLAAWPGAIVIATPNTREMAATKAQPFMSAKYTTDTIDAITKMLADGKNPRGIALTPFERAYLALGIEQMKSYGAELAAATIAPPTVTFDRELTIHLGAREVDVRFLGRGNTGGDAVVYVPDAKVIATGDLIVAPYPYAIGSFLGEWVDTLRALEQIDATTIVPGHGPVLHDHTYIDTEIALVESVRSQVGAAVAAKKTLDQAKDALDVAKFRKDLCGDDPWRQFGFDHVFVAPAVGRAYREATEGVLHDET
ncbi:MAG TPA: MBL fold metallo-hydrolase [Kofleriaceae bacterium]|nr:MBL fold metallo-hydrolase [Kofleriaceae bacterium]